MIFRARSLAQARAKSTVAPEASTVHTGSPAAMRVPGGDRSTAQSGQFRPLRNHNVARGVNDFGRFEREARRSRRQTSFARGDMTRKQWGLVRFEHVQRRPGPRVDLYEPDRVGRNQKISAVETDEIQFGSNCSDGAGDLFRLRWVNVDGSGGAAISKRRRRRWRGPLHAEANNFRFSFAREKQSRDALSGNATLKITIGRSAARAFRRGDMGASGAAPPLHEPELGLVRRRKRNLRDVERHSPRKPARARRGSLARFSVSASLPNTRVLLGDRRDRFRLVLEARAIDQPNRIMGADQRFDGAGDLVERRAPPPIRRRASPRQELISLVSSSPKTSIESGANPAWRRRKRARAPNRPQR